MQVLPQRLSVLLAVHRAGGVVAAADFLHIPPSAVSQQIRLLERECGARVLDRTPTGAVLTAAGKVLADAAERIEDLKERGYENAGLYDPAGVGGTHVMYVLHHADRPALYHGLPNNPSISPMVGLWKGVTKPLALLGIAAAAVAGFFHYTRVGPNEVSKEEEHEALEQARELKGEKHEA